MYRYYARCGYCERKWLAVSTNEECLVCVDVPLEQKGLPSFHTTKTRLTPPGDQERTMPTFEVILRGTKTFTEHYVSTVLVEAKDRDAAKLIARFDCDLEWEQESDGGRMPGPEMEHIIVDRVTEFEEDEQ